MWAKKHLAAEKCAKSVKTDETSEHFRECSKDDSCNCKTEGDDLKTSFQDYKDSFAVDFYKCSRFHALRILQTNKSEM